MGTPRGSSQAAPQGGSAVSAAGKDDAALGGAPEGAARTPAERQAELERNLDDSLSRFDETLDREQVRLSERQVETAVETAARQDADGTSETSSGAETASGAQGASSAGAAGGGAPRAAEPRGDDDDIVARQLREAAENETDPELREKLWQEYRDYKAGRTRSAPRDGETTNAQTSDDGPAPAGESDTDGGPSDSGDDEEQR